MDIKKGQQLEAKGWVETTAQAFLELTPHDEAYIELKLLISRMLRERRESQDLSQQALAEELESNRSRISKTKSADPTVSLDLPIRALLHLGVTTAELGALLADA